MPKPLVVQSPSREADQRQGSLARLTCRRCSALSQAQRMPGFVVCGSEQAGSSPCGAAVLWLLPSPCHSNRGGDGDGPVARISWAATLPRTRCVARWTPPRGDRASPHGQEGGRRSVLRVRGGQGKGSQAGAASREILMDSRNIIGLQRQADISRPAPWICAAPALPWVTF